MKPELYDRTHAGLRFDWPRLPPILKSLDGIPEIATELHFMREKSSHRGIHRLKKLRNAWLINVNQEFLEEISEVQQLQLLHIHQTTATDLTPLRKLRKLRRLIIRGGTKVLNLDWVHGLSPLESLAIENFKRVEHLDPLGELKSLIGLGIEGSMWTAMRVASLAPLAHLTRLRSLFMINTRIKDQSLAPLHKLQNLGLLECASFFPDSEFIRLRKAMPNLKCACCDVIARYGSTRAGSAAFMRSIQEQYESQMSQLSISDEEEAPWIEIRNPLDDH
ncbi:MAG: hypothetical protein K1X53_07360 [Candidatus Sumerlaeaceae bacterium]|nr:hypothetical protein [Candidatus Sumerlaeaceae bacterium]